MKPLAALLILAASGSASVSFWLALLAIWAGVAAFGLLALRRRQPPGSIEEHAIGRIQRNGLIRYRQPRPLP